MNQRYLDNKSPAITLKNFTSVEKNKLALNLLTIDQTRIYLHYPKWTKLSPDWCSLYPLQFPVKLKTKQKFMLTQKNFLCWFLCQITTICVRSWASRLFTVPTSDLFPGYRTGEKKYIQFFLKIFVKLYINLI